MRAAIMSYSWQDWLNVAAAATRQRHLNYAAFAAQMAQLCLSLDRGAL